MSKGVRGFCTERKLEEELKGGEEEESGIKFMCLKKRGHGRAMRHGAPVSFLWSVIARYCYGTRVASGAGYPYQFAG